MYAVLQRYTFNPDDHAALQQQIADVWVPLLRQLPGFVACYWLDSGAATAVAFCTFEDQASATAALTHMPSLGPASIAGLIGTAEMQSGAIAVYANAGL